MSSSHFNMVDVTGKASTVRRAEATGTIRMAAPTFAIVRDRKLPKGDALSLAEVAGILGAKQTSNLLPLCHPLPIEEIKVRCELDEASASVRVTCVVSTTAKTGVEMEALMGTSAALLCLYDLIKMVDPSLVLEQVRLNYKEGGKNGLWRHPEASAPSCPETQIAPQSLKAVNSAVLTVSDRVSRKESEDQSGPTAISWLKDQGAIVAKVSVVPDDKELIRAQVRTLVEQGVRLVVATGGTGMGPRDVTVQALWALAPKEIRGVGELLRQNGSLIKKSAWLSNSAGFVLDKTLIIALPGSPKAVLEGLNALRDVLPHALHIICGGNHG